MTEDVWLEVAMIGPVSKWELLEEIGNIRARQKQANLHDPTCQKLTEVILKCNCWLVNEWRNDG